MIYSYFELLLSVVHFSVVKSHEKTLLLAKNYDGITKRQKKIDKWIDAEVTGFRPGLISIVFSTVVIILNLFLW